MRMLTKGLSLQMTQFFFKKIKGQIEDSTWYRQAWEVTERNLKEGKYRIGKNCQRCMWKGSWCPCQPEIKREPVTISSSRHHNSKVTVKNWRKFRWLPRWWRVWKLSSVSQITERIKSKRRWAFFLFSRGRAKSKLKKNKKSEGIS